MTMDKRGVELSMNAIIIAVISLIVLTVLVLIFSGKFGEFGEGVTDVGESVNPDEKCYVPGHRQCVPAGQCSVEENIGGCGTGEECCLLRNIEE